MSDWRDFAADHDDGGDRERRKTFRCLGVREHKFFKKDVLIFD
jgi:hypothetical protein